MSERHRVAGRLGGLAVVERYGREWMSTIGRRGGRPRWQVTLAKAHQREEARGARLKKEVFGRTSAVPPVLFPQRGNSQKGQHERQGEPVCVRPQ